jgi:hypothetical protein
MERDARFQSLFYLPFRVPNKGAVPPVSLHRTSIERDASPSEPLFDHLSKYLVDEPTSVCPTEPP